jgi:predicted dehydrogenase
VTEPVGVALLGCAHTTHAWSYARAVAGSERSRLVGVHDRDRGLAEAICSDFEVSYVADPRELVGSPDVDAVVVCSETNRHREYVELAASRGRHVLCEKPIATTAADGQAMIDACESAGVQLHSAFVSRFLPLVQRARNAVASGDLGDLVAMVGGNRGRPPLPPAYPGWITSHDGAGGGALIDHSVHVTDVMRHVSGRDVERVSAEVGSQLWGTEVDDVALMPLVFEGGAVASVDPSWSVPEGNPWDYDFYLRLLGTGGSLEISDTATAVEVVSAHWGGGLRLASFAEDADATMIEAFIDSVRNGRHLDPSATGLDGLRALEVALGGYASAEAAQPVTLTRAPEQAQ